jgi:hypothetical protein
MRHLAGSKQVLAVASAIFLVVAASGTALAMLDPGQTSLRSAPVQRQMQQNVSGQSQQSPLPTPEPHDGVSFRGTVEIIAATGWVIGGHTVQVTGDTMVEIGVDVGSLVKVHAQRQADGSLVATQIELIQNGGDDNGNSNENENDNENDDHDDGNVNSNDNGHHDDGNVNSNDGSHDDNHEHNGNGGHEDRGNDHGNGGDDHGGDD